VKPTDPATHNLRQAQCHTIWSRHIEKLKIRFIVEFDSADYVNVLHFAGTHRRVYVLGETPAGALAIARYHYSRRLELGPGRPAVTTRAFPSHPASAIVLRTLPMPQHATQAAMNIALRKPQMTRDEFFAWAQTQDIPYEFDGFEPVAMTGGNINHDDITFNVRTALRARLKNGPCRPLGPNAGVATIGDAVRYPDALVTCSKVSGNAHVVPGVVIVFEVVSRTSGRIDRVVKLREYLAVPSIRRYVILEHNDIVVTVLSRNREDENWTSTGLTAGDVLTLPEVGIEVPVAEFYQDVDLPKPDQQIGA